MFSRVGFPKQPFFNSLLAGALVQCPACAEWYGDNPVREMHESTLVLRGHSTWVLGGTETGFNIPDPPTAVSASYDLTSDEVIINWANRSGGYDSIFIVYYGSLLKELPGNVTRYVHKRGGGIDVGFSSKDIVVFVLGYKGGVPSNGAGVRLRNRREQESLMNVPFTLGVAPGFEAWRHDTPAENLKMEQGNSPGVKAASELERLEGKGFYQSIRSSGCSCGGLARRFLGLNSGHAYRVSARVNVLEPGQGAWAFSAHAAPELPGRVKFTTAQLAGVDELPSKAKGPTAAQIARIDSNHHTTGKWLTVSSSDKRQDNVAGDITLPDGCDSVTVWFRLESKDGAEVAVGFDSLTIQDMGKK